MRHRRLTGTIAFCVAAAVISIMATAPFPGDTAQFAKETARPHADEPAGFKGVAVYRKDGYSSPPGPAYSVERTAVTESGILGPGTRITVANLTVRPGQYIVSYTFEARFQSSGQPEALVCGVIDSNGRDRFLTQDRDPVYAGEDWERRSFAASFSLPDMTLGIRCVPVGNGLGVASFRDIQLAVTKTEATG